MKLYRIVPRHGNFLFSVFCRVGQILLGRRPSIMFLLLVCLIVSDVMRNQVFDNSNLCELVIMSNTRNAADSGSSSSTCCGSGIV